MMSIDLAARQVVMSAHLYYDRGSTVLSDADYDALTERVASGWRDLRPFLRWQLGSPEEILATGAGVKLTLAAIHGADAWHRKVLKRAPELPYSLSRKWRLSPKGLNPDAPLSRTRWTPIAG